VRKLGSGGVSGAGGSGAGGPGGLGDGAADGIDQERAAGAMRTVAAILGGAA
jgi:hypothetical protein